MNYTQAQEAAEKGEVIYRKAWPVGTVLVLLKGYDVPVSSWSERTPLTKEILQSLGIDEALEVRSHYALISGKSLFIGYTFEPDDISATDWQTYSVQASSSSGSEEVKATDNGGLQEPEAEAVFQQTDAIPITK